mmetsp:Transcript_13652/g.34966  ORF Transcript_13652/g.34966 Transcript_13652/m.34966 type:complete len:452 (-) Transcript_13652:170-1525(-)
MAGRPNYNSTGGLRSTYGAGAYSAQGSSRVSRPMGAKYTQGNNSHHFAHPSGRTSGGNSYSRGHQPGEVSMYPAGARGLRSAGYGQGKLLPAGGGGVYRPNAPYHVGTPANLQRKPFDNWSAKPRHGVGEFGSASNICYWGDFKARDEKMREMRGTYDLTEERRSLVRQAFNLLDKDGDGLVSLDDVRKTYNAASHPMVKGKQWTEEQAFRDVIARFKGSHYAPGETAACLDLRLEELEKYYEQVGAEVDDEYFAAMMVQAWQLPKQPGMRPEQGWGAQMLGHLALVEANMMGDEYHGQADLAQRKLDCISVGEEHEAAVRGWREAARGGGFSDMLKAAEAIAKWVQGKEAIPVEAGLPELAPLAANAVRFVRLGGAEVLAGLAEAQDVMIKKAVATAMFACMSEDLARAELSRCDERQLQAMTRRALPAIAGCSDAVARNKAERVRTMLV